MAFAACRVAAGAVAKKILKQQKVDIIAYTLSVGNIVAQKKDFSVIEKNLVRTCDLDAAEKMIKLIDDARKDCDSVGGVIEAVIKGYPAGLGEPIYDKLNARLAYALMSIGTMRGIEFGDGFAATKLRGSEHNDAFYKKGKEIHLHPESKNKLLIEISK